jgi:hypothetical protein
MIELNLWVVLATGLVPLAVGALWYGPLFDKVWMKEANMSLEKIQGSNMLAIYGLSLVFSIMFAGGLMPIVIHQMGIYATVSDYGIETPGSEAHTMVTDFMAKYGTNYRTFQHGVLHGLMTSIFLFLPVIATNALFERKSWKYIFLNLGYWAVSAMIMGGIISAYA